MVARRDGTKLHLMPEYIKSESNGEQVFHGCKKCVQDVNDKSIPKYSLANGYDFGSASRIGLPVLSELEKSILSPVHLYGRLVKLVAPAG